jgi:hypothetical protein
MAKSKKTESTKKEVFKFKSLNNPYKWVGRLNIQFRPAKEGDKHGVYETDNAEVAKYLEVMEGIIKM